MKPHLLAGCGRALFIPCCCGSQILLMALTVARSSLAHDRQLASG